MAGREARGLVVSVYLDPDNPLGSTHSILDGLEHNQGAMLS